MFHKIKLACLSLFMITGATSAALASACGLYQVGYNPNASFDASGCFIYEFASAFSPGSTVDRSGIENKYLPIKFLRAANSSQCNSTALRAARAKATYNSGRYSCWKLHFNGNLHFSK